MNNTAQIIVAVGFALAMILVGLGYCMQIAARQKDDEEKKEW